MQFYRGDNFKFKFQRKNRNNEVITTLPKKLYFTIKNNNYEKDFLIQKTLENGIIKDEENYYHVEILPEDTNDLKYKEYVYDLEVITDTYKKTIASGTLLLKEETTFVVNEG